uniref:Alpha-carbonic anhydrase domain-containing protein n=1 Tax=Pelusios castaneus TaxID=367368 RepID=A0A8C8VHF4_9SAUR
MAQQSSQWGYDTDNGPDHWHKLYPIAKGKNQSPIEINSKDVHYDPSLLPWFVGYDPVGARTIANNGRTCKVVFDDTFDRSVSPILNPAEAGRMWLL